MSEQPIKCRTPRPSLPPGSSPKAYYWCNEETGEWELIDEWVADGAHDADVES